MSPTIVTAGYGPNWFPRLHFDPIPHLARNRSGEAPFYLRWWFVTISPAKSGNLGPGPSGCHNLVAEVARRQRSDVIDAMDRGGADLGRPVAQGDGSEHSRRKVAAALVAKRPRRTADREWGGNRRAALRAGARSWSPRPQAAPQGRTGAAGYLSTRRPLGLQEAIFHWIGGPAGRSGETARNIPWTWTFRLPQSRGRSGTARPP